MAETERAQTRESAESRCRLLIVDDQSVIRKFIRQVCANLHPDYEVFEAEDGDEAWSVFKRKKPDLVITDVCMPKVDGIELLRRIRRADREMEVIMITGFAETKMVVDALKSGATNFIEKPFTVETISGELGKSLARWKAARERERLEGELARERTLREASAKLATAGRLMAGIALEMRNPLTWVKGNAEVVSELLNGAASSLDPADIAEMTALLADIREGAEAIEFHLGQISRFQGLSGVSEDRPVNLSSLLSDSALLADSKRSPNVVMTLRNPPVDALVRLNAAEMESCIVNLLVAAFESVRQSGGEVEVRTSTIGNAGDGGWAEVTIEAKRAKGTVVRLAGRQETEDQSFWLWAAHKAAEQNGVSLEMDTEQESFTAVLRLPWFGKEAV